jgi:hypothetical protein
VTVLLDSGTLDTDLQTASVGLLAPINDSIPRIVPRLAANNTFTGTNTLEGAVTVDDTLHVTGAVDLDSTLNVDGSAVIDTTLSVGTNLTVAGTADVTGAATVGGTLGVTGALTASAAATANSLGVNVAAPAAGVIQNSGNIEAGGYVYAPNGFKQPGTGGETLKMIRGIVDSAGAVIEGSGFTSVRNSTGNFTITFSTAFSDIPSFFVTSLGNVNTVRIITASSTQVNYTLTGSGGVLENNDHHVLCVGPK